MEYEQINFAGNLEAALIEFDPFYSGYSIPGAMTYNTGATPCYMPSRTRNLQMKTVRELEQMERNAEWHQDFGGACDGFTVSSDADGGL